MTAVIPSEMLCPCTGATQNKVPASFPGMRFAPYPPYLTTSGSFKCCSASRQQLDPTALLSLGAAFREHVEEFHRPSREDDANQVRESQFWRSEKPSE